MPKLTLLRRSPRRVAFWPDFDPIHIARIFFFLPLAFVTLAGVGVRPLLAQPSTMNGASVPDSSANKVLTAATGDIRFENLKDLNSQGDDATMFISPADGSMYFTSSRSGKQIIYISKRVPSTDAKDHSGHWGTPEVFAELPDKQNISSLSIASDGVTAVVGICNRPDAIDETCDIYQAQIIDGKLDNITPLASVDQFGVVGCPALHQSGWATALFRQRSERRAWRQRYLHVLEIGGW